VGKTRAARPSGRVRSRPRRCRGRHAPRRRRAAAPGRHVRSRPEFPRAPRAGRLQRVLEAQKHGGHLAPPEGGDGALRLANKRGGKSQASSGALVVEYARAVVPHGGVTQLPVFDQYAGEVAAGLKHGQGTYTWGNGATYEGEWRRNVPHGQGKYSWPDGESYEGGFRHGRRHGSGIYAFPNGASFVGGFRDDAALGRGICTLPGGRCFYGEYRRVPPRPAPRAPRPAPRAPRPAPVPLRCAGTATWPPALIDSACPSLSLPVQALCGVSPRDGAAARGQGRRGPLGARQLGAVGRPSAQPPVARVPPPRRPDPPPPPPRRAARWRGAEPLGGGTRSFNAVRSGTRHWDTSWRAPLARAAAPAATPKVFLSRWPDEMRAADALDLAAAPAPRKRPPAPLLPRAVRQLAAAWPRVAPPPAAAEEEEEEAEAPPLEARARPPPRRAPCGAARRGAAAERGRRRWTGTRATTVRWPTRSARRRSPSGTGREPSGAGGGEGRGARGAGGRG
jgi:hypothetical protein